MVSKQTAAALHPAALRGIGRKSYRDGHSLSQALTHARRIGAEQSQLADVTAGWRDERAEVVA